jgi:hypothetical protein
VQWILLRKIGSKSHTCASVCTGTAADASMSGAENFAGEKEGSEKVRKKAGRSRKHPSLPTGGTQGLQDLCLAAEEAGKGKRKAGRPRKHPLPPSSSAQQPQSADVAEEPAARSAGAKVLGMVCFSGERYVGWLEALANIAGCMCCMLTLYSSHCAVQCAL